MENLIKLEEEKLLFVGKQGLKEGYIKRLHDLNIYTINDFIDTDVSIFENCNLRKENKIEILLYYELLKYKYQGKRMIRDVILQKTYRKSYVGVDSFERRIEKDLSMLGISNSQGVLCGKLIRKIGNSIGEDEIDMIEIIRKMIDSLRYRELADFYLEYYENEIQPQIEDKKSLESLKNELVDLLNQSDSLDEKISGVLQQINNYEGEKNNAK